jgi:hypothetical protein
MIIEVIWKIRAYLLYFCWMFAYNHILPTMSNRLFNFKCAARPELCLHSDSSQGTKEEKVVLKDYEHKHNQQFYLIGHQGAYLIISKESGKALRIPEDSKGEEGTQCIFGERTGESLKEKWKIINNDWGTSIISAYNGLHLSVEEGKTENGNRLVLSSQGATKENSFQVNSL